MKEMERVLERRSGSIQEVQYGLDPRDGAKAGSLRGVRCVCLFV